MRVSVSPLAVSHASIRSHVRALFGQLARFGVVGLGGFVIDIGVFNLLIFTVFSADRIHEGPIYAKIISTALAIIFNWLGNRYWTFGNTRRSQVLREGIEFIAVSIAGSLIALLCLWVSHYLLGFTSQLADNVSSNVVGLALGTAFRFIFYRYWVFHPERSAAVVETAPARIATTEAREDRTVVVMPTYNEADNIETAVAAVRGSLPAARVLIVDDASPDGTGEIADRLAAADPHISVLHRTSKNGLGRAYLDGFATAIASGAEVLVEMDADGSHPASVLPTMIERLRADRSTGLVIGSRWVAGGGAVGWPWHRRAISIMGNLYARFMLSLDVRDMTAGYRAYRAEVIEEVGQDVASRGYAFQVDMTRRTADARWGIAEVPITFIDRVAGQSKMSTGIVIEAMRLVTVWGIKRFFSPPAAPVAHTAESRQTSV